MSVQITCLSAYMHVLIGVREHFRWGGGGGDIFLPEALILARKLNMFGKCIFVALGGGVGEKENITLLK